MRICLFTSANSLQGGAELCLVLIARHLLDEGHDVHIVLPKVSELTEHYESIGVKVHVLYWQHLRTLADPLHVLKYLFCFPIITVRLARLLRRERIDLLHVNEILDIQGLLAARLARTPAITHVRVILPGKALRWVLAKVATALAQRVVCVSGAVHRMALHGSKSPKVCVLYDGGPDLSVFDPDRVEPIRPTDAGDAIILGMVAKLVRAKGHLALIDLAEKLRDRGYDNLHYVIVGGPVAGHEKYAAELQDQIQARGLADRVHLVGQQHDVAGYIAGMDIVCHLPLNEDPFPGVPMEAAALRKPVLSFVSGGVPEELTHPDSIRLAPIGDIDALVPHAAELIERQELRKRMGDSAREEIRSKVSLQRHLGQVDKLYEELLHAGVTDTATTDDPGAHSV